MGVKHHGSLPNGLKTAKVSGSRYRLLHQMGGSRTPCHHHREKHPYLHVEKHHMQIWDSEGACIWQWKTIQQQRVQEFLLRARNSKSLLITNTPIGKRTGRSHKLDIAENHQNPAWSGKGYLARQTAKRLMGISDDCKDTHRGDPISTYVRSWCSHPSRDRPHQLSRAELHEGQKRRSYTPTSRLGRRGPSNVGTEVGTIPEPHVKALQH